jgi:phage anti-repressor protein
MNNNLETIRIFSEDVIPVYDTDTGEKVVLGRELHERLKIKTAYKDWIKRMIDIGFVEGTDFSVLLKNEQNPLGGRPSTDHVLSLDMAKHIAMIQRTPQGMEIRQKLIDLEKNVAVNQFAGASKELQAIFVLDNRSMQHEKRISALETNMTVDYEQQRALRRAVNRVVVEALGGKTSPAYLDKSTRCKVYSECNKDAQDWFHVNSISNVPRKDFDNAIAYIERWRPCANTVMMIQNVNSQTQMAV